jgi:hypothetical protein
LPHWKEHKIVLGWTLLSCLPPLCLLCETESSLSSPCCLCLWNRSLWVSSRGGRIQCRSRQKAGTWARKRRRCLRSGAAPSLDWNVSLPCQQKNRRQTVACAKGCIRRYSGELCAFRRYVGIAKRYSYPSIIPYHVKSSPKSGGVRASQNRGDFVGERPGFRPFPTSSVVGSMTCG